MLGLGGIFAEAVGDVAFAVAPLARGDAEDLIDALPVQTLLGEFRGEPAVDRARARARARGARPDRRRARGRPLDRHQPADRRGRAPVVIDALVELEGDGVSALVETLPPAVPAARRRSSRACRSTRASSATVAFHNLIACGYKGELFPINREGVESFGRPTYKSVAEVPRGRADLVFLCTPNTRERGAAARVREGRRARRLRGVAPATARPPTAREMEQRLVALGRELGIADRGPERPGPDLDRRLDVRADRRALPAARSDLGRLAEREPRLELHELRRASPAWACRRRSRAATRPCSSWPTTSSTTARIPRPPSRSPTSRASATGGASLDVARAHTARKPLVVVRGGVTSAGQARREQSHRRARLRRPDLLRRLPPGRHHARRDDRGGLRGRGGVRDPAAAARPAHADLHRRGRLGRAHLRRLRAGRARADPAARRPARGDRRAWCRRAGAAATRSTSRAARRATRSPRCSS